MGLTRQWGTAARGGFNGYAGIPPTPRAGGSGGWAVRAGRTSAPRGPQEVPRGPKRVPRSPKRLPRGLKRLLRGFKRLPRAPQEIPKRCPRGPERSPKLPKGRPKRRKVASQTYRFFIVFSLHIFFYFLDDLASPRTSKIVLPCTRELNFQKIVLLAVNTDF